MGGMPQRPPFQTYQQQPGGLPGQPGVMAPGQQGGIPGQPPAGMPGQPGLVRQRMPGMQVGCVRLFPRPGVGFSVCALRGDCAAQRSGF